MKKERTYKYRLNGPVFGDAAVNAAASFLREPEDFGTAVRRFEHNFTLRFRMPWSVAVSNATMAYYLILKHLGIGPGDKILVPAYTFVSAGNIPELLGAETVFCDVEKDYPCISLEEIIKRADPAVKAILYVSSLDIHKAS